MAAPQFIAVADAGAPVASAPKTQPERAAPPEAVRSDRSISPFRETGERALVTIGRGPPPVAPSTQRIARRCFRPAYVPGTTREHGQRVATALPRTPPRPKANSYLQHTPRLRPFKHLPDLAGTGHHPGSLSPSPVSGSLRVAGHVA